MKLRRLIPSGTWDSFRSSFVGWVTDVQAILSSDAGGGATLRDNLAGEVKTVTWAGTRLRISTSLRARPLAVVHLSTRTTALEGEAVTGLAVRWAWVGDGANSVDIISVDGESTNGTMVLWLVGG